MLPRIEPAAPPYAPRVAELLRAMMPAGSPVEPLALFRAFALHTELAEGMRALGGVVLSRALGLPMREREIVIHRVCARAGCEYEWGVHAVFFAPRVELTAEQLRATVHGDATDPVWPARESLLIRLADAIVDHADVPDDLWAELEAAWTGPQLVALLVLAGWYRTIAGIANALRISPEPWAERFPVA